MGNQTNIKYVNEVSAKITSLIPGEVDASKLHISSFELVLAVNAIPYIKLEILPEEIEAKEDKVSVSCPDFDSMSKLYYKLSKMAVRRFQGLSPGTEARGTIEIELKRYIEGELEEKQKLQLRQWILTDAALSTISRDSAPVLTVIFKHPIEQFERVGEIYETPMNDNIPYTLQKQGELSSASNMVDLMKKMYEAYAQEKGIKYYKPVKPEGLAADTLDVKKYRNNINQVLPDKHLETTDAPPIFLTPTKLYKQDPPTIILSTALVTMGDFDHSIWSTLVNSICPVCMLQVVPKYAKATGSDKKNRTAITEEEGKLELAAYSPWDNPKYNITGDMVISADLVAQDPDPISGTALLNCLPEMVYTTDNKCSRYPDSDMGESPKDVRNSYYIPPQKALVGRLQRIGDNPVVSMAMSYNPIKPPSGDVKVAATEYKFSWQDYKDTSSAYSKAIFESFYRKNCTATLVCPLTFWDSGSELLYPGSVTSVRIREDSTNDDFRAYMVRMVARGGTSGPCTTTLSFTSARPHDPETILVQEGHKNPCYY